MKLGKKIRVIAFMLSVLTVLSCITVFATDTNPSKDIDGKSMEFGERLEYALQGTVAGMLAIFAVLGLLAIIISLSKVVFYDLPRKREQNSKQVVVAPVVSVADAAPVPVETVQDNGELVAVITAAVAAMIESSDYKNEFAGGFRVVSFKRTASGAWNKK